MKVCECCNYLSNSRRPNASFSLSQLESYNIYIYHISLYVCVYIFCKVLIMYYETNVILCKIVSISYICKLMLNYQLFFSVFCFLFLFLLVLYNLKTIQKLIQCSRLAFLLLGCVCTLVVGNISEMIQKNKCIKHYSCYSIQNDEAFSPFFSHAFPMNCIVVVVVAVALNRITNKQHQVYI